MKRLISLFSLLFAGYSLFAQITLTHIGENQFENIPFAYEGTRVLMADRADDPQSENIFLFSKPAKGTLPDTLFVQRYQKTNSQWTLVQRETVIHDGAISLLSNRKGYLMGDGQHMAAFLFYQFWDHTLQHKQSVHLLLLFRGKAYEISRPAGASPAPEELPDWLHDDFAELPAKVKQSAIDYWEKLTPQAVVT